MKPQIAAVGATVHVDACVVWIASGENGRTRGTAEGISDEVVGEGDALLLHLEDLRHVLHQVPRQIVGEDEDDVRAPRRRRGYYGSGRAQGTVLLVGLLFLGRGVIHPE